MFNKFKDTSIYFLLSQLAIRSRHDFARLAEQKYNLTWSQLHTLCLIEPETPIAMNAVSNQLLCDASNVTGIIDRLVAGNYVVRTDDPNDRRVRSLKLTTKGKKLRTRILRDIDTLEPESFNKLTVTERDTLQRLVKKLLS